MSEKLRLSAEEFDAQQHKLKRLSGNTIDLARFIIVEGLTPAEAARKTEISRQNVAKTMARVYRLLSDVPDDWEFFSDWMPKSLAEEVREKILVAKEGLQVSDSSD